MLKLYIDDIIRAIMVAIVTFTPILSFENNNSKNWNTNKSIIEALKEEKIYLKNVLAIKK